MKFDEVGIPHGPFGSNHIMVTRDHLQGLSKTVMAQQGAILAEVQGLGTILLLASSIGSDSTGYRTIPCWCQLAKRPVYAAIQLRSADRMGARQVSGHSCASPSFAWPSAINHRTGMQLRTVSAPVGAEKSHGHKRMVARNGPLMMIHG